MNLMDGIFKVKDEHDMINDDLNIVETKNERCTAIADVVKVSNNSECVTFYGKNENIIGLFPKEDITKFVLHYVYNVFLKHSVLPVLIQ